MINETFSSLLHDPAHWEFELFVGFVEMVIFDVIIGLFVWPLVSKHWAHHIQRDQEGGVEVLARFGPQSDGQVKYQSDQFKYDLKTKQSGRKLQFYGGTLHENLVQRSVINFVDDGFCFFCHGAMSDEPYESGVQHCEICGAINIQDEWISPQVVNPQEIKSHD